MRIKRFNDNTHLSKIVKLNEVKLPDPQHGDFKLSVYPFENTGGYLKVLKYGKNLLMKY